MLCLNNSCDFLTRHIWPQIWLHFPQLWLCFFAMVKIRRIGHLLACSFSSSSSCESSGNTRRKQTGTCTIHLGTPRFFFDSEPPIKWLLGGSIRCGPTPLTPHMGGAKVFLLGVVTEEPFWPPYSQIFLGSSWPQISLGSLLGSPPTPLTSYPLTPL